MPSRSTARLELAAAAILFSTGGAAVKAVDFTGWQITCLRSGIAAVAIWLMTRQARGAVFLWHETQGGVVERNVIIDCDSGICLGNSHKPENVAVHCTGVIVRNNFVTRAPENGILADYTRDCKILHNTVYDPQSRLGRLIRLVHDNDGLLVANNLLSGPPLRNESSSRIELRGNLIRDMTAALVDPAAGNLRLTSQATAAIDEAAPLPEATEDIERLCQQSNGGVVLLGGVGPNNARWQDLSAVLRESAPGCWAPTNKEHFGLSDGFGDPVFSGQFSGEAERLRVAGGGKLLPDQTWAPLATGEFLLGYPDEAQETPGAAMPIAFSRNGTFMAYRKLHEEEGVAMVSDLDSTPAVGASPDFQVVRLPPVGSGRLR